MEENERGPAWIARKTGRTREYISAVVHGHRLFSDKLAQALTESIGIQFPKTASNQRVKRSRKTKG
jgi:hypothetical protein